MRRRHERDVLRRPAVHGLEHDGDLSGADARRTDPAVEALARDSQGARSGDSEMSASRSRGTLCDRARSQRGADGASRVMRRAGMLVLALFVLRASAQDAVLDAQEPEEATRNWGWFGDFWAGYDHVSGLPNNRDDLSRGRGRVRAGAFWNVTPTWEIAGSVRLAA